MEEQDRPFLKGKGYRFYSKNLNLDFVKREGIQRVLAKIVKKCPTGAMAILKIEKTDKDQFYGKLRIDSSLAMFQSVALAATLDVALCKLEQRMSHNLKRWKDTGRKYTRQIDAPL